MTSKTIAQLAAFVASLSIMSRAVAGVGVSAKPIAGAEVILDGSREMRDQKWTYWKGPRFASSLPIKWQVVEDPVDSGHTISSFDSAAAGGKFGAADIITKKPYRDFRLHVEFLAGPQAIAMQQLASRLSFEAEGKGFEPSTGFPAPDFESKLTASIRPVGLRRT